MQSVTWLGSSWIAVPVLLAAGLTLASQGQRLHAFVTALVVAVGVGTLVITIKILVARARPDLGTMLVTVGGPSFPSGHAAQATAMYGAVAYLAGLRCLRWRIRVTLWTAVVLIDVLVGFSRLYLGTHWLTDVLGGYALGGAWLAIVITTTNALRWLRDGRAVTATAPSSTPTTGDNKRDDKESGHWPRSLPEPGHPLDVSRAPDS